MLMQFIPRTWLFHSPIQPAEKLFVIFSSASAARPLDAWRTLSAGLPPHPIWAGTVYSEWTEVMHCVAMIEPESRFFDWIATTESTDWGWLAVSSI